MEVTPQKLRHKKGPGFSHEYADRVTVLGSNAKGYGKSVTIVFGRDVAEVSDETVVRGENGVQNLVPDSIEIFRLEIASITLPESIAKLLVESIQQTFGEPTAGTEN